MPDPALAATASFYYYNAINEGIEITSTSDSDLNGVYSIDDPSQFVILVEYVSCRFDTVFTDGNPTKQYLDQNDQMHTFTAAQFITFAKAVGAYVDALRMARVAMSFGQDVTWPSNQITIA